VWMTSGRADLQPNASHCVRLAGEDSEPEGTSQRITPLAGSRGRSPSPLPRRRASFRAQGPGGRQCGKRVQRWKGGFATKKEAQAFLTDVLSRLGDGSYVQPTKLTLRAFVDHEWLPAIAGTVRPPNADAIPLRDEGANPSSPRPRPAAGGDRRPPKSKRSRRKIALDAETVEALQVSPRGGHTHTRHALSSGFPVHVAARIGDRPETVLKTYAHLCRRRTPRRPSR
jgi:hypothetical protein